MRYLILSILIFSLCHRRETPDLKITQKTYVLRPGDNLDLTLRRLKIKDRYHLLEIARRGGFPIRRCRVGDTIRVRFQNDSLLDIAYKRGNDYCYYLSYDGLSMAYQWVEVKDEVVKGEITSTLYESMLSIGEPPDLVVDYASIFAWQIDFFTETRSGDSFFVLLKREYVDSVRIGYSRIEYLRYDGKVGTFSAFRFEGPDGRVGYYDEKGQSLKKVFLKAPLSYARISSYFSLSRLHPILKIRRPHWGVDYVAPRGTPVSALGDGIVTYAGWKGQYGRLVEIRHAKGYETRYGHLSRIREGIRKGRRVRQGDVIGYVGATGLATGPHLHFEMRHHNRPINPVRLKVLRSPGLKKEYLKAYKEHVDSILDLVKRIEDHSS
ncbi:MAG TPA: hypothetical protein EYP24_04380 [bacterium (Candidatus Stahlbacteria)]|nr:hypothetical protein [Candidatus Stahlbacteria bacterium]